MANTNTRRVKVTHLTLRNMKEQGERIAMLTAYDASFARLCDQAGVEILLVGDSLGMVIQGMDNTLSVTMDQMVYHCQAVARGVQAASGRAMVVGDMPFLSYQASLDEAIRNAGRLLKEGRAEAVKLAPPQLDKDGRPTGPPLTAEKFDQIVRPETMTGPGG